MIIQEVNPIPPRANCKICVVGEQYYMLGGFTSLQISNKIYQFRLNHDLPSPRMEWKQMHFEPNLFTARNSFAACTVANKIYIWGGLAVTGAGQQCLSDLIQVNVDTGKMATVPLKEPIPIHSSVLLFDAEQNELVAYGGSDQTNTTEPYLYRLKLADHQWRKSKVDCKDHQGCIWQHTAHLTSKSLFSGNEGRFMTVIGGCKQQYAPYKAIVQIDLLSYKATNRAELEEGLVAHDSLLIGESIMVFGGAIGGDFSKSMYLFRQGKVQKRAGHCAVGCSCCLLEGRVIVYGGVSSAEGFSQIYTYSDI